MTGSIYEGIIGQWEIIAVLGGGLLLYFFFSFFNHSLLFGGIFRSLLPGLQNSDIRILSAKAGGFLWLGVIPGVVIVMIWPVVPFSWIRFGNTLLMLKWMMILVPVVILVSLAGSGAEKHQDKYPQVREKTWTMGLVVADLVCWAVYLLGYEAFFRGFLLFGMSKYINPWVAIVINTVFYSLAHLPKGKGETAGAVPLGLLLCFIALRTGNFWVPFFVHLIMAWSNELFTLKRHKSISSPLNRKY